MLIILNSIYIQRKYDRKFALYRFVSSALICSLNNIAKEAVFSLHNLHKTHAFIWSSLNIIFSSKNCLKISRKMVDEQKKAGIRSPDWKGRCKESWNCSYAKYKLKCLSVMSVRYVRPLCPKCPSVTKYLTMQYAALKVKQKQKQPIHS